MAPAWPVFRFQIDAHCSHTQARCGCFHTPHGPVTTPRFMPVGTLGTVKGVTTEQLAQTGAQMVLSNTYHLHLQPGEQVVYLGQATEQVPVRRLRALSYSRSDPALEDTLRSLFESLGRFQTREVQKHLLLVRPRPEGAVYSGR